jgi:uncharacterized protein DUF4156
MSSKGILPRLAALVLVLNAPSCASVALAPGADKVRFTENPADVDGCKALGEVTVEPAPFQTNSQGHNKLKNAAFALGGNTVLQTFGGAHSGSGRFQGMAYRCGETPARPLVPPPTLS